ncbi:lipoyl(octanoyl) transferase LipB [Pontibacter cellulosilyticus]|uniref:Octanoyltransferase n=1 Tax=Pontibacter cellulosilyticus TaxID=1720253 RepID=A0A923N809_9BACT|nr:lipoyl(octanoyl) transferase LipB [Pontibacter cellulosilyticus]MBC5993903.1 lipoyl(octanoyl) transferase LipB [Pontibacter cellulosilyticus]
MLQNKKIKFEHLGLIDYKEAWDYQDRLFNGVLDLKVKNRKAPSDEQTQTPNYLLFCSHPHVYTLGKSGHEEHLLLNEEGLKAKGATYYKINRGGDITYHGPGQIVGYPILDLENFFTDIHKYLRFLEEAVILTLAEYDIKAGRIAGLTGVWLDHEAQVNPRKICAMGVKCSRWVTMHGFAFNINADLNYFNNIVPCGISDKKVTSLAKELGYEVPLPEVEEKLKKHIAALFEAEITE